MSTEAKPDIFERQESNVRSYCRLFPRVFDSAKGSLLYSSAGECYIDFFSGAGALNYGHNDPRIKQRVLDYLSSDRIVHGLDLQTVAKGKFLERFTEIILNKRKLPYKVQFCGPTGTNAVEAALKLARKVKQRSEIFSFMGGYHGVSLGSLAATGNHSNRAAAGLPLSNVSFMPYPFGFMSTFDSIAYIDNVLQDTNSGVEKPAAIIFETVQAEGGIVVAPIEWILRLRDLCYRHDILLICDDIQVGCGRTGPFFSFERAGIVPDMVTLSKSISGYGAPMALLLMRPELDVWNPADHNGTFRGYQLAFVAADAALQYWENDAFERETVAKGQYLEYELRDAIPALASAVEVRGVGMVWGLDFRACGGGQLASQISSRCFELGLVAETVGRHGTVMKIMPPLTTERDLLKKGCEIIRQAITECVPHAASSSAA